MRATGSLGIVSGLVPEKLQVAFAQAAQTTRAVGTESDKGPPDTEYLTNWPVQPRSSVPEWARPGRVRFARWDGGQLEAAKAVLSGWSDFSPVNPNYLDTMVRWYDPRTISFLREAHINLIWVTFSNGFSNETEKPQQEVLRTYIAECHKQGIRTVAYESVTNMFFEDMFERVPESRKWLSYDKDGQPVMYGAADYKKTGRVTRYLADVSNPAWFAYVKGRIDLAMTAGADGIMYDNCLGPNILEVFQQLLAYARNKKSDFLIMANFHRGQFTYNRMLNAITTEEGGEAGIFSGDRMKAVNNRWQRERSTMAQVNGGFLANNLGRMRVFSNLSEGWKPFMIESRIREDAGMAETHIMPPDRQKLVMAENIMFNSAYEPSVEIEFAQGLWNNTPEAQSAWAAIGEYNRFAMENEEYFVGAQPLSSIAIVLDNHTDGMELLNGLSGRNLQYDILYEDQLSAERLKPYSAVAVLTAKRLRAKAVDVLQGFVAGGGAFFLGVDSMTSDLSGASVPLPPWTTRKNVTRLPQLSDVDAIASQLRSAVVSPSVVVTTPPHVLYSVAQQPEKARILIHFVNYIPRSEARCRIRTNELPHSCKLISPDRPSLAKPTMQEENGHGTLNIDGIEIYSVLVLEMKPR